MLKGKEDGSQPIQTVPHKWDPYRSVLVSLLGLFPLIALFSPPPLLRAEEAPLREEARFDIYVAGKEIGHEKFSLSRSADGVESTSVVNFRDPGNMRKNVRLETQLSMDGRFLPRSYQLHTDVEGKKGVITGTFAPGEATFEYRGDRNPLKRGLLVGDRYVILDTNVFHHFIFIARLYDLGSDATRSIEAVIPQELDGGKLKVSEVGLEMVPIRGKKMTLHHLNVDSGMLSIDLWVDDRRILYKIALPAQKIEVIRSR